MTTLSQVRKAMAPVLARNPDLVLMGRFLIIKPVRHILKGIFLDRSSNKNQFVTSTSVRLFVGPWTSMRGERFNRCYIDPKDLAKLQIAVPETKSYNDDDNPRAVGKVRTTIEMEKAVQLYNRDYTSSEKLHQRMGIWRILWNVADPASIRLMCEMIEDEVLPDLRKIVSFDDFVTFADTLGWADEFPYQTDVFERMFIATAEGDLDKARALWDSNEQDPDYYKAQELENFVARTPNFHPALLAGDRVALANIFHEWEAQSVKSYGLESFWERTPFPLEL
jgi:hypothetical protein